MSNGKERTRRAGGDVTVAVLLALTLFGGVGFYALLRASLPPLDGELRLQGLTAPVHVTRDVRGVPTISAHDRLDRARVLGMLHAHDRYFQMDLLRRTAAGELAELFGTVAVGRDRGHRMHRFRVRARQALQHFSADDRAYLDAYVEGVNAGLAGFRSRPFEYWLLRSAPAPWRAEDSLLVVYSMYLNLQDEMASRDNTIDLLREVVGDQALAFFVPTHTAWDAQLDGETTSYVDVAIPVLSLQPQGRVDDIGGRSEQAAAVVGSNNFAVAGSMTQTGAGMVAGDMHLELRVPNTWYRAAWTSASDGRRITGVTLPGVPVMVAGSNEHVAWAFTNSYLDTSDLIAFEWVRGSAGERVITESGEAPARYDSETIFVRGAPQEELLVIQTPWGPVVDADRDGRYRAVRWIAHDASAVDLGLLQMETVDDVATALRVANAAGMPAQNIVAADATGHIGWSIAGRLPDRVAPSVAGVVRGDDARSAWRGVLPAQDYPRRIDPPSARLWTANSRVATDTTLDRVGDGGYVFAARARQIRDDLRALSVGVDERDLLRIQLDDRAVLLDRWHTLLLSVLQGAALDGQPQRVELRRIVEQWSGSADVDSAAYRIVRAFRLFVADQVFGNLFATASRNDARFNYRAAAQWEEPLWRLVEQRGSTGRLPQYAGWDAQLLAVVDEVGRYFAKEGQPLASQTWGARNTLAMDHPFATIAPRLRSLLSMERQPLPGDGDMPRVQGIDFGASQRMVVSPGHEENGIFHMPGGQSGHPLSPFFRAGHDEWARGIASPFLPGEAAHRLRVVSP